MVGRHPRVWGRDVIERHTSALVGLAQTCDMATAVPTCDGWNLADLVWHLTEVQLFWTHIIAERPAGPETYEGSAPGADLAGGLEAALCGLLAALDAVDPATPAWSWSNDQTAGFTLRRQSHEALIHHVDGLIATGRPLPTVSADLAADGIDELIDVMLCGIPDWATFTPAIEVVTVETIDTGDSWTLGLGMISGTSSQSGLTYNDAPAADRLADVVPPDVTVRGRAIDLLLWLWGRTDPAALDVVGEGALATNLRELVVMNTQ